MISYLAAHRVVIHLGQIHQGSSPLAMSASSLPMSREDFISAVIAELEVHSATSPPLTGPEVFVKMTFDFPELTPGDIRVLSVFLVSGETDLLSSAFALTPTFLENMLYLASKTDQQLEIALGELMAAVHIHLTRKILLWEVSDVLRLFPQCGSHPLPNLCSTVQEHFCAPITSYLVKCLGIPGNGDRILSTLVSLLHLLCHPPDQLQASSLLAYLYAEDSQSALLRMISQCFFIYRDVTILFPEYIVATLPHLTSALQPKGTNGMSLPTSSVWLSLISSISAAYAPSAFKRSTAPAKAFHFLKGFCYEHLSRLAEIAESLLHDESDAQRRLIVFSYLTHIGVLLVSPDSSGVFHIAIPPERVFEKLLSSRLVGILVPFAFDSIAQNRTDAM